MPKRRQKRPSRGHLFRALKCVCDPNGAEKGCSEPKCPKCLMYIGVDIGEGRRATCLLDPRVAETFSSRTKPTQDSKAQFDLLLNSPPHKSTV